MEPNPFIGTRDAVAPAVLEAVEQKYGFTLPPDYKAHVLQHNGGWPERRTFIQVDEDGENVERRISNFKPFGQGKGSFERNLESLRDQLHPDLVPFGSETGGDQFCLSVGPEDYGAVYYVAHEFYTPPKKKDRKIPRQYGKGVSFLAPSFTAFMEGLVNVPEEA